MQANGSPQTKKNKESVGRGKASKTLDARRHRSMRKRKGHETAPDVAGDKTKEKVLLGQRIVAGLSWCVPVASPDKEEERCGRRQGNLERERTRANRPAIRRTHLTCASDKIDVDQAHRQETLSRDVGAVDSPLPAEATG